jgi:translation initiation factor 2 beta subunit (eIF-2beta)/eIF-5
MRASDKNADCTETHPASAYLCDCCGSSDLTCIGTLGMLVWFRCRDCGAVRPARDSNHDGTLGAREYD